jgi:uncharacterized protein YjbI with pentapeptide repeats
LNKENKEKVKSNVCLVEGCGRQPHKESKCCIFHAQPEEKNTEEFKIALQNYIKEIKKEDKDYDFMGFIFNGDINFREDLNIIFFKNANFSFATFEGYTYFSKTIFKRDAKYSTATLAYKKNTNWADNNLCIAGASGFEFATFNGITFFNEASFEGYTGFSGAIFNGPGDFSDANFEEDADFEDAEFNQFTLFDGVTFKGDANFCGVTFVKGVSFSKVNITSGKKINLEVKKSKVNVSFERAYLKNIYLELYLGVGVLLDFTNALIGNTNIKRNQIENRILQEEKKEFSKAKEIYLLIKNNFHSIGKYDDESWAFKKEKDMERKNNFHFKTLHKWLWSCFLNALYGYGEKPERVIISAILIILIYTFIFMNYGIVADPQLDNLPKYNILKELFMGIRYGDLLIRFKDISWEQIKNCLYFSTFTFTTLGLGDFRFVEGLGRIFVGTEAFIGVFMIALFVDTFARRTGGR